MFITLADFEIRWGVSARGIEGKKRRKKKKAGEGGGWFSIIYYANDNNRCYTNFFCLRYYVEIEGIIHTTRMMLDRRFGSILIWGNSNEWLLPMSGRRNSLSNIFILVSELNFLDRSLESMMI